MEQENLTIFDDQKNKIGVATRKEVHKQGFWHETFHCWLIQREQDIDYIYFQIRSEDKEDYPNLLDITAAGHITANESIMDGVREVKEELGIEVSFNELHPLGIINYCIEKRDFIDKELANVFLYEWKNTLNDFTLQKDEVSGIVRTPFNSFYDFCFENKGEITIKGFEMINTAEKIPIDRVVRKEHFVPHGKEFYQKIANLIKEKLKFLKLKEQLHKLEASLLKPETRSDPQQLDRFLADNFFEFGSSGNAFSKEDCVGEGGIEVRKMTLDQFEIHPLSESAVLTTFKVRDETRNQITLRSSIWKYVDGRWQMFFHQGTPCRG